MKKLSTWLVPLALALSQVAVAQNKADATCPHQGIERVVASLRSGNTVACGSGIEMNIGGLRYTSPAGACTLLLVYTPEHWIPVSSPGSYTYASFVSLVRERVYRYQCKTVYFLGIIPVDGECRSIDTTIGDEIPNYVVQRCEG